MKYLAVMAMPGATQHSQPVLIARPIGSLGAPAVVARVLTHQISRTWRMTINFSRFKGNREKLPHLSSKNGGVTTPFCENFLKEFFRSAFLLRSETSKLRFDLLLRGRRSLFVTCR